MRKVSTSHFHDLNWGKPSIFSCSERHDRYGYGQLASFFANITPQLFSLHGKSAWSLEISQLESCCIYEEFTLICDENLELAAKTITNENRWHQSKQNTNFFFEKSHQENGTTINFSNSVSHENFPVDRPKRPFSICTKKAKEYSDIFWN